MSWGQPARLPFIFVDGIASWCKKPRRTWQPTPSPNFLLFFAGTDFALGCAWPSLSLQSSASSFCHWGPDLHRPQWWQADRLPPPKQNPDQCSRQQEHATTTTRRSSHPATSQSALTGLGEAASSPERAFGIKCLLFLKDPMNLTRIPSGSFRGTIAASTTHTWLQAQSSPTTYKTLNHLKLKLNQISRISSEHKRQQMNERLEMQVCRQKTSLRLYTKQRTMCEAHTSFPQATGSSFPSSNPRSMRPIELKIWNPASVSRQQWMQEAIQPPIIHSGQEVALKDSKEIGGQRSKPTS